MIHDYVWTILVVITALVPIFGFWYGHEEKDGLLGFLMSLLVFFLVCVFGWAAIGHCHHAIDNVTQSYNVQVFRTDSSLIVVKDGKTLETITDAYSYNLFKGYTNCTLERQGWVDIYNNTNFTSFILKYP